MKQTAALLLSLIMVFFFAACGGGSGSSDGGSGTGTLSLNVTDAPALPGIKAVYIQVVGLRVHKSGSGWIEVEDFNETEPFNLLELQNGKFKALGDLLLPAGHYTQLRFMLRENVGHDHNPGCYVVFDDDSNTSIDLPSAEQSGYKGIGEFDISADAKVEVTADFNILKGLHKTGNGRWILKPTIRLVVNELSGEINGTIANVADFGDHLMVHAYRHGSYSFHETVPDENGTRFSNALTSAEVNMTDGGFVLSCLAEGKYDLAIAEYDEDGNYTDILGIREDVEVEKGKTTTIQIDTAAISPSEGTGTISLRLSDAPFLGRNVKGVYIKINDILYHHNGRWVSAPDFNGTESINLLTLQNGKSIHLSDIVLPAGHYTQIRFRLDPTEGDGKSRHNPGCHILFDDNSTQPLFVPGGAQSGYKAVGEFNVTVDSKVEVTADFDVHKSIVKAGHSGKYILKPTIRLVVNELSGEINGTVRDWQDYNASKDALVVFAYKENGFESDETEPDENGTRFVHAVGAGDVNMTSGTYTVAYLAEGTYDLAVAEYIDGSYSRLLGLREGVPVRKNGVSTVDLNTSSLSLP
ncbi:DUF4382 domain-containing protein [Hydrogenimonas urashimensis]|uniref:DUF4382 domain-containing protein n=1 Tax=Hydrogenimonas urashimensis TaxID=2740515 RepID=UPI0019151775|nr:DUF4382 domain-containing protein [Hydrogenimonas urashimensis]